jgi:predicted RNA-binding Zn-ribbon protein involved in translation (DUF1610 family)
MILLRREGREIRAGDHDYPQRAATNGNGSHRRCVYCAYDLHTGRNRCPECGRVQPIRCAHCGQIIMNGLADHGPHCPMVVGAVDLEEAVEQL